MASFYKYTPPKLAAIPDAPKGLYNVENRPGVVQENDLLRQVEALPSLYNPFRAAAKSQLSDALKGYGDLFTFGKDDPNTPVDESLNIDYNENAQPGEYYRDAIKNVKNRRASRGTLYSSMTDKDIIGEAARISAQAKEMVQKYAGAMEEITKRETGDRNDLVTKLTSLYGEDAKWLADQVPPKLGQSGSRPDGLFTWKEWAAYKQKQGRPNEINPANFWRYISTHGGDATGHEVAPPATTTAAAPPGIAPQLHASPYAPLPNQAFRRAR